MDLGLKDAAVSVQGGMKGMGRAAATWRARTSTSTAAPTSA